MRRDARIVLAATAVALVAVGAFLISQPYSPVSSSYGLSSPGDEDLLVATGFDSARIALEGTEYGPGWGELDVYSVVSEEATAWVYTTSGGEIVRVDNFGVPTEGDTLPIEELERVAEEYVAAVGGPSLEALSQRGEPEVTEGIATFLWQEKEGNVWLPRGVTLQVSETGSVLAYLRLETPIRVDLDPAITESEARSEASDLLDVDRNALVLELEVVDYADTEGDFDQRLVWEVTALDSRGQPVGYLVMDAMSGDVLGMAPVFEPQ